MSRPRSPSLLSLRFPTDASESEFAKATLPQLRRLQLCLYALAVWCHIGSASLGPALEVAPLVMLTTCLVFLARWRKAVHQRLGGCATVSGMRAESRDNMAHGRTCRHPCDKLR